MWDYCTREITESKRGARCICGEGWEGVKAQRGGEENFEGGGASTHTAFQALKFEFESEWDEGCFEVLDGGILISSFSHYLRCCLFTEVYATNYLILQPVSLFFLDSSCTDLLTFSFSSVLSFTFCLHIFFSYKACCLLPVISTRMSDKQRQRPVSSFHTDRPKNLVVSLALNRCSVRLWTL